MIQVLFFISGGIKMIDTKCNTTHIVGGRSARDSYD